MQSISKNIGAGSGTIQFSANNKAGDLIIVVLRAAGADTSLPTDTAGNSYIASPSLVNVHAANQGNRLSVYYAQNIAGGSGTPNTVTVSATGATGIRAEIFEYSGLSTTNTLDQAASAPGSGTAPASPTITTTSPSELVLGAAQTGNSVLMTQGSGFTLELCNPNCTTGTLASEDQVLAAVSTLSAGWSLGATSPWSAVIATFQAGPPFSNARTDLCGSDPMTDSKNCTGTPQGTNGSSMVFRLRTGDPLRADPLPFSPQAPANTGGYDPDFGTYLVLASDTTTNPSNPRTIFVTGSAGNLDLFSSDDSLYLLKTSGGNGFISYIPPATFFGHNCVPLTAPCSVPTGITTAASGNGDATHLAFVASWSFSRSQANVLYEAIGSGSHNGLQIQKRVITNNCSGNPVTSCTATMNDPSQIPNPTLYVDFTSDSPVPCSVLPSTFVTKWQGSFTTSSDGSVAYGLGGDGDWIPNHTYSVGDTFFPQTKNGSGNQINTGYEVTTAGTSVASGSEPDWLNSCHAAGSVCTVGNGVAYTSLGSISGQGPGYYVVSYSPTQGCMAINTRNGRVTAGHNSSYISGQWKTDNQNVCTFFGLGTQPCNLPDLMTLHAVEQMINPDFVKFAPTGGEGRCTGDPVFPDNRCSCQYSGANPQYCNAYYLQKSTGLVRPCTDLACEGHASTGYFDWSGSKYTSHDPANPSIPGTGLAPGSANPGHPLIGDPLPADQHGTYRWALPGDTTPNGLSVQDVPSVGRIGPGKTQAHYDEFDAAKTDGSAVYRLFSTLNTGSNVNFAQNTICVGSQTGRIVACESDVMGTRRSISADRIAFHAYTRGDEIFPLLNNTGLFTYVASVGGTSGSTVNGSFNFDSSCTSTCADGGVGGVTWTRMNATATHPGCNQLRGDTLWSKSTPYNVGDQILPTTLNANQAIYVASGTPPLESNSMASPNWTNSCPQYGNSCTDNNITWTNIGTNDCRTDIMFADTTSAHH